MRVPIDTRMLDSRISIGDGKLYPGTSSVPFRASVTNSYALRQSERDCCGVGFSSIILMCRDEKGLLARDLVTVLGSQRMRPAWQSMQYSTR